MSRLYAVTIALIVLAVILYVVFMNIEKFAALFSVVSCACIFCVVLSAGSFILDTKADVQMANNQTKEYTMQLVGGQENIDAVKDTLRKNGIKADNLYTPDGVSEALHSTDNMVDNLFSAYDLSNL